MTHYHEVHWRGLVLAADVNPAERGDYYQPPSAACAQGDVEVVGVYDWDELGADLLDDVHPALLDMGRALEGLLGRVPEGTIQAVLRRVPYDDLADAWYEGLGEFDEDPHADDDREW